MKNINLELTIDEVYELSNQLSRFSEYYQNYTRYANLTNSNSKDLEIARILKTIENRLADKIIEVEASEILI